MPRKAQIDIGLKLLHQGFGLENFHFGLFTDGQPPTLDGLREAQVEYTKALLGMIPEGVRSVLDVGCGIGMTVKALTEAGFAAEGLSPDQYHKEQFPRICGPEATFHHSGFEDFDPGKTYDCLIFSESPMYIDKDAFFPKSLALTRPGSHILVADFFHIADDSPYPLSFGESDFLARAERAGLEVTAHRDVTREILPNLDMSRKFVAYGLRIFRFVEDCMSRSWPRLAKVAGKLFGRKLRKLEHSLTESLPAQLDVERFLRTMHYAMYRFSRP